VYELWLANEVKEGRIAAPGFFANDYVRAAWCKATWTGDGPGSIDPQKEVDAAEKRVNLGTSTLQAESILHDGVDWETKNRQRAREIKAQKDAGTSKPAPPAAPGGLPVPPDPVADEDMPPPAPPPARRRENAIA
jgi:capsid protein